MRDHRKTARPGEATRFENEKIIVARMGKSLVATYDDAGVYVKDAMLLSAKSTDYSLIYLTGILNSKLLTYFYQEFFITIDVLKNALLALPIYYIGSSSQTERLKHDKMVALVKNILKLHQQKVLARAFDCEQIVAQIERTDTAIDQLVYQLYELSDEEIVLVEKAFKR